MKYSDIPNVNQLLALRALQDVEHNWAKSIIESLLDRVRNQIQHQQLSERWSMEEWNRQVHDERQKQSQKRYRSVINATGIVVHTNLGRAPLPQEVFDYMQEISGYTDLELRLEDGKRGGRLAGIRNKLCQMTGAEDALVVNNNAAAVLLILSAISANKEVVVSRGELVEIGGSFRVPDVIQQGGAILREVGCTNRLHLKDIEGVLTEQTGAILRVHTSNYRVVGFTSKPSRSDVCQLAQRHQVPVVEDLGSGLLKMAPNVPWKEELEREESIERAIAEGVDVVCASGDKLLGGVQAGLIVGRRQWIEQCRRHPLYRALRLDKMLLAGLEATLQMHIEGRSNELPVWAFLQRTDAECKKYAEQVASVHPSLKVERSHSLVGGGALPDRRLDTWAVVLQDPQVERLAKDLRTGNPAIMGRIQQGTLWLDMRTVAKDQLPLLQERLTELLKS